MATCYKAQTIYAFSTSATATRTAYSVMVPDTTTPVATCTTLMITGAEKVSWDAEQSVHLTSRTEAEPIAAALWLLLAIAFGYRMIRHALASDAPLSDEKH